MNGPFPDLSHLTSLIALDLSKNNLSGFIPDLSSLTHLKTLELSGNLQLKPAPVVTSCQKITEIPINQCQTLIAFYNHTNGPNWTDTPGNNWNVTNTPCGWEGVRCHRGNVTEIVRYNKNLSGTLPELTALIHLEKLSLSENQLSGSIPDLGALRWLERLDLSDNQFSGSIPDNINQLTHLEKLNLSNNQLTGIIPELSTLSRLVEVKLSNNALSIIFPISSTRFCSSVTEIVNTQCQTLIDIYNHILGKNGKRQPQLNIGHHSWGLINKPCMWNGIKCKGRNVTTIELSGHHLTGHLPELSALTHLEKLNLSKTRLSGPLPDLSTLARLHALDLRHSLLKASFPITNTFCHQVTEIPFSQCQTLVNIYNGTKGKNWVDTPYNHWGVINKPCRWTGVECKGENVTAIVLADKKLSGSLPNLTALTHLEKLDLSQNNLRGSIPDLTALVWLEHLDLSSNQFRGVVPELDTLTYLKNLELSNNRLIGIIPQIEKGPISPKLSLSAIAIPIPDTFCQRVMEIPTNQCQTVVNLYNQKNGKETNRKNWHKFPEPCQWSGIKCHRGNIIEIKLRDHKLKGSFPDLSALTHLEKLDLSRNQLSGPFPNLNGLVHLKELNLSRNQLTGVIPDFSALTRLEKFNLQKNPSLKTSFPIPPTFCQKVTQIPNHECQALIDLYNNTNGKDWKTQNMPYQNSWGMRNLPCTWEGIRCGWCQKARGVECKAGHITSLKLSDNNLNGPVPDLSALNYLTEINLVSNNLSGFLPDFSALRDLKSVRMKGNQLKVTFPIPNTFCHEVTEIPMSQCQTLVKLYNNTNGKNWKNAYQLGNAYGNNWGVTKKPCRWKGVTCKWGNVIEIQLSHNKLVGILPNISALSYLEKLDLNNNQLSGSIPQLSTLIWLKELSLYNNQFSGSLPDLSHLTHLEKLEVSNNQLSGLIPDLSPLFRLRWPKLERNALEVNFPIPNTFCQKTTGIITSQCQVLVNLYNHTDGKNWQAKLSSGWGITSTPCSWQGVTCQRMKVTEIELVSQGLNGSLPDLSALTELEKLDLHGNKISGKVPDLSSLTKLKEVDLPNYRQNGSP